MEVIIATGGGTGGEGKILEWKHKEVLYQKYALQNSGMAHFLRVVANCTFVERPFAKVAMINCKHDILQGES